MSDSSPISYHLLSHSFQVDFLKAGQIGDIARVPFADSWRCCPIEPQEIVDVNLHPDCRAHDSNKTGVASGPSRQEAHVPHHEMHDERRPDLPPDGVGVRSVETLNLQRLLEFLEEDFNGPSRLVEFGNRACGPCEVVRDEDHFPWLSADIDDSSDAAERFVVFDAGLPLCERDDLIGQDTGLQSADILCTSHDAGEVVSLACHEGYAAHVKVVEQAETKIATVGQDDIPCTQGPAEFGCPRTVILDPGANHDETRKHLCHVGPHMQFRRGLAMNVSGPVNAVEGKRNYGRVDRVDVPRPEPRQRASVSRPPESRRVAGEPIPQGPVETFGYDGVSGAVRIREGVASGWRNASDAGELGSVYCGDVDELVEAECMQEVPEHQRVELGTVRELTRFDGLVVGDPVDQMSGKPLDNLSKNGYHSFRCLGGMFHTHRVLSHGKRLQDNLLLVGQRRAPNEGSGVCLWDGSGLELTSTFVTPLPERIG